MGSSDSDPQSATAALRLAQNANERLSTLEQTVQAHADTIEDLEQTVAQQRRDLARLRQLLEEDGGPRWRIGKYLKTLHNAATTNTSGDGGTLTVGEAWTGINKRVSRTTVYDDFDRVDGLLEEGVLPAGLSVVEEPRSSDRKTRLRVEDVSALPRSFGGVRITGMEEV